MAETLVPFGRHRGGPLSHVPPEYVFWLLTQKRWLKARYPHFWGRVAKFAVRYLLEELPASPPNPRDPDRFRVYSAAELMERCYDA
jgi:hypothetical protein